MHDARQVALRNARGTRRAHKLKSFQWNFFSYGAVASGALATVAVLATSSKVLQAIPAALATVFAGLLSRRPELREACRRHHAAARDIKHEIARFSVDDTYDPKKLIDSVQEIDKAASLSAEEIEGTAPPASGAEHS